MTTETQFSAMMRATMEREAAKAAAPILDAMAQSQADMNRTLDEMQSVNRSIKATLKQIEETVMARLVWMVLAAISIGVMVGIGSAYLTAKRLGTTSEWSSPRFR